MREDCSLFVGFVASRKALIRNKISFGFNFFLCLLLCARGDFLCGRSREEKTATKKSDEEESEL